MEVQYFKNLTTPRILKVQIGFWTQIKEFRWLIRFKVIFLLKKILNNFGFKCFDQTERHYFWARLWLFFFPFLFPPKKGKKKRRNNGKNRDQKSCLSVRSISSCKFGSNLVWQKIWKVRHLISNLWYPVSLQSCTKCTIYIYMYNYNLRNPITK